MEYVDRVNNTIGPELQAYYEKTMLGQAVQSTMFDKYFSIQKTQPLNSTETIKFRKWINMSELYFGANNVNATLTGNTTADGERSAVLTTTDAYSDFVLPEGSSGDSKASMKYVELESSVFAIGDWMPYTEEIDLLHPVWTVKETAKQMGEMAGNILDGYYRDQLVNGAGHAYDISAGGAAADSVDDAAFTNAFRKLYVELKLSMAQPISSVLTSSTDVGTTPIRASYIAVGHPVASNLLLDNASFVPVEKYAAGTTLLEGEVGTLGQFRIIENENAPLTDETGGVYKATFIVMGKDHSAQVPLRGKNRMEFIFQGIGSAGIADPLKRKGTLGWKTWLGSKTLYPERLGVVTALVQF